MANPWLKKNPYLSIWLSGANSVAHSARGRIAAEARRQSTPAVNQATQEMVSLWAGVMTGAASAKRKKRR